LLPEGLEDWKRGLLLVRICRTIEGEGPLYVLECRRRSTLDMIACVHAADRVAAWQAMFDDLRRKGVMPADATE
jgi:hypothetical protein